MSESSCCFALSHQSISISSKSSIISVIATITSQRCPRRRHQAYNLPPSPNYTSTPPPGKQDFHRSAHLLQFGLSATQNLPSVPTGAVFTGTNRSLSSAPAPRQRHVKNSHQPRSPSNPKVTRYADSTVPPSKETDYGLPPARRPAQPCLCVQVPLRLYGVFTTDTPTSHTCGR